jgi:hypothetical protein
MYKCGLARKNSEASGNLDSGNEAPTLQRKSTFAAESTMICSYFGESMQHFQITCYVFVPVHRRRETKGRSLRYGVHQRQRSCAA